MPPRSGEPDLVRAIVGVRGRVRMRMQLIIRFDYGSIVPWVRRTEFGIRAVAGPDTLVLQSPVTLRNENFTTSAEITAAEFTVSAGETVPVVLMWHSSHESAPPFVEAGITVGETEQWWRKWSERCTYVGPWREEVVQSMFTLNALTY